jgi:GntR family histidine utilization transcriptional repressor
VTGWQDIEAEVLRRIRERHWPPGSAIPHEADLAREFGVARATVNRALQALAEAGWLDRRRRAGTRVAAHPVRKAVLSIPILKAEIEAAGLTYGYRLLRREVRGGAVLEVAALHLADGAPFAHEDRRVNLDVVPAIAGVDLRVESANAWLVANAPFSHGNFALGAENAAPAMAELMGVAEGAALLVVERMTWDGSDWITEVRLTYGTGHRFRTVI